MSGTTRHPNRTRLAETGLAAEVLAGSRLYSSVRVVERTGSTNADLLAAATSGTAPGAVLVAEEQTAGRGRLDRSWQSQPGASLTFSVLLRPSGVPASRLGWLPLLTGVAVASALRAQTGVEAVLKWPNDVLAGTGIGGTAAAAATGPAATGPLTAGPPTAGPLMAGPLTAGPDAVAAGGAGGAGAAGGAGGKLAGILAEQAGDAVVVGIGLNVSATESELPGGQATSLWLAGAVDPDRRAILIALLGELEHWYLRWSGGPRPGDADACGLRDSYLRWCATVGRDVRVQMPGGKILTGRAVDVDSTGQLLVSASDGVQAISAGDVVHVR